MNTKIMNAWPHDCFNDGDGIYEFIWPVHIHVTMDEFIIHAASGNT